MALQHAVDAGKLRFVMVRHEQGAAFMADVYGRLTGKPGVCFGTLGPGATNLVTGVADANMDRSPVVVITGQADTYRQHKESHQFMDVVGMFKPITKWSHSILRASNTAEVMRKAFKVATTEKPGACHIELPEDVAAEPLDPNIDRPLPVNRVRRPVCDDKTADAAVELIRAAKKPVILAGNGCVRKRASKQLTRFADLTGIAVISTFMAKGCIPRTHPSFLGTVGLQSHDFTNVAIDESDLVISIGFDMVEYHPRLWNPDSDKKILHIDFLEAEIDNNYTPALEVVSDLGHALWALNERVEAKSPLTCGPHCWSDRIRSKVFADIAEYKDDTQEGCVRPQKALWDIREALAPHDILLSDVGAHKMWVSRYYQCDEPNTCLISNGFCSMGFALPGAIAAKIAHPDRNVVVVCGDGGFLMNVQEMETAVRIGANIVVVIWVDGGYGLISWKQQNHFGAHSDLSFGNPDFAKLASAFGWAGFEVKNSADFRPALDRALASDRPAIVAVDIDYRENDLLTKRLGNIRSAV